jgi:hypothetical protein
MKTFKIYFATLFIFISSTFVYVGKVRAQEYCTSTDYGPVCIKLDVDGNSNQESMREYWPLEINSNWKMAGRSNKYGDNVFYKLQIIASKQDSFEGQSVIDVNFIKNKKAGYWNPYKNENLSWQVVDFDQSNWPFIWSIGTERFDRSALPSIELIMRQKFDSLDQELPPYVLMPEKIQANSDNSGLKNSIRMRMQYSHTSGDNWDFIPYDGHSSWFNGITNAQIKVPMFGDQWVEAKRVEFVELSLPNKYNDSTQDPYSSDRTFACRQRDGHQYYRGVREDWFFVKNTGIALIISRDVGLEPDNECIYEVAREDLEFNNSDTYSYLVTKESSGFDPNWNYPSMEPTSTPVPTALPTNTPIPTNTSSPLCQGCSTGLAKEKGNADCNNKIDLVDYAWWLKVFKSGSNNGEVNFNCQPDDSQNLVNLADFEIWWNSFTAMF